jgi:hypothetical protein
VPVVTPATTTTTASPACSSNLCNNRGTCQQSGYGTGIQCYCLTGWSGSRCQYSKLKVVLKLSITYKFNFLGMRTNLGRSQDLIENNRTILTNAITHIRRQRT